MDGVRVELRRMRGELKGISREVVENAEQVEEVWPHLATVLLSTFK